MQKSLITINKQFNKNLIISEEENIYFNKVTVLGFIKDVFIIMKKKLEIIVTYLVNLDVQHIGIVI